MCARISTYWVSDSVGINGQPGQDGLGDWLHRSDLGPNGAFAALGGGGVMLDVTSIGGPDLIASGVIDLQVAVGFSSELFRSQGLAVPVGEPARWAFTGVATPANAAVTSAGPAAWFEARTVRVNLMNKKSHRRGGAGVGFAQYPRREDGAGVINLQMGLEPDWFSNHRRPDQPPVF